MKTIEIHKDGQLVLAIRVERDGGKTRTCVDSHLADAEAAHVLVEALCTVVQKVPDEKVTVVLGKTNTHRLGRGDPFPHEN
jgi:hypothetical protein